MQSCAVKKGLVLLFAAALAGCGGGGTPVSKSNSTVTQVTLTPSTVSVVAGQVTQISAAAQNSSGLAPSPLPSITFNSSDTSIASVSPGGLVCGGTWDALFIVCNGLDRNGNPIAGSALVTASAGGVTSAPIPVTVHPAVSSILVDPVTPSGTCFSLKTTHQFTAHACSSSLPHDASGPCAPNGREITSLVGPFNWSATLPSVATVDANGLATANTPGLTGILASVGTVTSPGTTSFRTCMPVQITLHINGDPAGQPTESATMNVNDTRVIEADMVDEAGVTTNSAPVSISSIDTEIAQLSGVTLTAESPGGGGLVAACLPPTCGAGLNLPVYSNLFSISVNGSSPAAFVYATTTFAPPTGTTPTIVPIDASKTPVVAGTAINMPSNSSGNAAVPNSMIFAPNGAKAYLGTNAGIAVLDTAANTVSLVDPFVGKVLAVSPDGNTVILSNAASAPDPVTGVVGPIEPVGPAQRLVILSVASNTVESFVLPGAVAAAFTPDGFKAFVATNDGSGNVFVFSPFATLQTITVPGAASDVTTLASGSYAYFANPGTGIQVVGACNNVHQLTPNPATNSTTIQLLGSSQNANLIVALDSTGVDIETATVGQLTTTFPFTLTPANCTPPITYSNQFIDFGLGPITAHQLLVPTNGTGGNSGSHIVVLPVGINQLLVAVPGGGAEAIPLAGSGATEALSGGLTLDGNSAWVGVGGTNNVHQIVLTNAPAGADVLQVPTSFKKSDGTPAPPNLVGVKPH